MTQINYTIVTDFGEIKIPEFDDEGCMNISINDSDTYINESEAKSIIEKIQIQLEKLNKTS